MEPTVRDASVEILADIRKALADMTESLVDVVASIDNTNRQNVDALIAIAKNVSRIR